ncbi:membrane-spanning 4-domains subfamily A member 6B-like [Trichechus inunguis]
MADRRGSGCTMLPYVVPSGNVVVLTPSDFSMSRAEKSELPNQDDRGKGLKNEVKVLGTLQVLAGMMIMSLGITLGCTVTSHHFSPIVSTLMKSMYPFIGAKCFIVSGLLSLILEKRFNKHLAWSTLAINITSLLAAAVGFIILTFNLAAMPAARERCLRNASPPLEGFYYSRSEATNCLVVSSILLGVLSVMLIFTGLEFTVAVPSSILWWKQTHPHDEPQMVHFLPQSGTTVSTKPPAELAGPGPEEQ